MINLHNLQKTLKCVIIVVQHKKIHKEENKMELKPTYNARGEKRAYYIGEDGEEYFMYKDERTGYSIREMNKDDVIPWYDAMKMDENQRKTPMERAITLASVTQKVEKMIGGESIEKTMLILDPKGTIIGELDFTGNEVARADLQIFFKDEETIKTKGDTILELIRRMNSLEKLYDEIWVEHTTKGSVRIA